MKTTKYSSYVLDGENSGLLNRDNIDYTSVPYKLKDHFKTHCIVMQDLDTKEIIAFYDGPEYIFDGRPYEETDGKYSYTLTDYTPVEYKRLYIKDFLPFLKEKDNLRLIGHNIINYDLLVWKLSLGLDYEIEVTENKKLPDTLFGKPCRLDDTMVLSKTLNADRFGGHSLDNLAKVSKSAAQKIEFRKKIPKADRFEFFAADMLYYNIYDVLANTGVFKYLASEWRKDNWKWGDAYSLEKSVADIITRQSHRGFKFFKEDALERVKELDSLIQEAKDKIEPLLPKKPIGKTEAKGYILNAPQFLKGTGEKSKRLLNFVEKHNGEWVGDRKVKLYGKVWSLPIQKDTPVREYVRAEIKDTTHIKKWLVQDLGWVPLEWKDRDLTTKQKQGVGKLKRNWEEFEKAVDNYVVETLNGPFCNYRLEHLKANRNNLRKKLLDRGLKRSLKVLTNPSFTVGQEKDPCPNLMKLKDKFPHVEDMVKYLTYNHRRNTILGGGFDPEYVDISNGEAPEKGYIYHVRDDGRISTPAGTCDAATRRMRHMEVANVPRTTSLYGREMRSLFGVDKGQVQIGYDFDSLEARIEAHYCWKYDKTKEYCKSLLASKPNSVHCKLARAISGVLKRDFGRDGAKSVRYSIAYGSTPPRVAKIIGETLEIGELVFDLFWSEAKPLARLVEDLKTFWETAGKKKYIVALDGGKVYTRSPHSVLNTSLQSGGVICAKRAMVIHEKKLRKEGMIVDFFKDTLIENKSYCQQLIAYHDEAQLEVDAKGTRWKTLPLDKKLMQNLKGKKLKAYKKKMMQKMEAAKKAVEASTGLIWSDIGETTDRLYIGYHRAGELAVEAVREAGEYYNLNVPLTAGYSLGKNWADCH